jgi:hypothetical protein
MSSDADISTTDEGMSRLVTAPVSEAHEMPDDQHGKRSRVLVELFASSRMFYSRSLLDERA